MKATPRLLSLTLAATLALAACSSGGAGSSGPASSTPPSSTPSTATASTTTSSATSGAATASASSSTASPSSTTSAAALPLSKDTPVTMESGAHALPYLAWTLPASWTQTVKDQGGEDVWTNRDARCLLDSSNIADASAGTDAAATTKALDTVTSSLKKEANARVTPMASLVLPRTNGSAPLAFETRGLDYLHPKAKVPVSTLVAARRLSGDKVLLMIRLTCATSTMTSSPQVVDEALAGARIATALHR